MRKLVKERKKPKLKEFSFIVNDFKPVAMPDEKLGTLYMRTNLNEESQSLSTYYTEQTKLRELSYNHFVSCQSMLKPEVALEMESLITDENEPKKIEPDLVNGYDGFSGAHDNMVWMPKEAMVLYTMYNKLLIENTKTRQQQIFTLSEVRLSCLARSPTGRFVAVGDGEQNNKGYSQIHIVDLAANMNLNPVVCFVHGVQSLVFTENDRFLVALSTEEDNTVAVIDVHNKMQVVASRTFEGASNNKIMLYSQSEFKLRFATFGTKGSFIDWTFDIENLYSHRGHLNVDDNNLAPREQCLPQGEGLELLDFTSAAFIPTTQSVDLLSGFIILGTACGGILALNLGHGDDYTIHEHKKQLLKESIGHVSFKSNQVVLAGSKGTILKYRAGQYEFLPGATDPDDVLKKECPYGGITALQMDDSNTEGIVGTDEGYLCYINLTPPDKLVIPIVSKPAPSMETIEHVLYDQGNPNVFMASTSKQSGTISLYTSQTIDKIHDFTTPDFGPISFVIYHPKNKKYRMIGHKNGYIKIVDLASLDNNSFYSLDLEEGELLTAGSYSPCGKNLAFGTSFGSILLCQMRADMGMAKKGLYATRIDRCVNTKEDAVTSIQMTTFNPTGTMLVAFDNGHIRTWQSSVSEDKRARLQELKNIASGGKSKKGGKKGSKHSKNSMQCSFDEMGDFQFDLLDEFDMFANPHGTGQSEADAEQERKIYTVSETLFL
jgi:WD40 repeat protein